MRLYPSPNLSEFWLRYTVRYESGFAWSFLNYDKHLYMYCANSRTIITGFTGDSMYVHLSAEGGEGNLSGSFGFADVMGQATGDGLFHTYEVHVKADTNSSNGVVQLWSDGILKIDVDDADTGTSPLARIDFHENQYSPSGGPYYVDYDDMVIYDTTPPNVDAASNPMIGPIGWGT